jgi:hypothetical protein
MDGAWPDARAHSAGARILTGSALAGLGGVVVYVVTGPSSWLSAALVALAIGTAALVFARTGIARDHATRFEPVPERLGVARRSLSVGAALAAVATVVAVDSRAERGLTNADIVTLWLIAIVLLLLAAWWRPIAGTPRRSLTGTLQRWRPGLPTVAAWSGMMAVALLPRVVRLDRFTTVIDGDEGSFMLNARLAQRGELADVFGPGFLGNPNLYPAMAGWLADSVGSPPYDLRVLSGVVGALGVIATWRLGRYVVGPAAAGAGAIILATMPFNLQFSRSALNNITDATVLATALLLLVRGVSFSRSGDAALAGVVLGFGFYGYFGGRALPAVLVVSLVLFARARHVRLRDAARLGGWMAAGFVVTALPLIMALRANPAEFSGRMRQVSTLSGERLRNDPGGTIGLVLEGFRDAALYPLIGNNQGFFRHPPPFLGWCVALLLTIGVAVWLARWARHRDPKVMAVLFVPWLLLTAGISLTTPVHAQRLIALTPLFALAAGSGLVTVASWLEGMGRPGGRPFGRLVVAAALVVIGVTELRWYASEDRQIVNYGDYRTTAMWDIGWRVGHASSDSGGPPQVLFAGPPFVFTGGFNNLRIQAPELAMSDVVESLGTVPAPELTDDAMLIIIGERQAERCAAESIYPSATVAEAHARDGTLLYIALYREPLAGWSSAETPAETTFTTISQSPCRS